MIFQEIYEKWYSRIETQSHIEWNNKTKKGHLEVIEQVRAGQLADM